MIAAEGFMTDPSKFPPPAQVPVVFLDDHRREAAERSFAELRAEQERFFAKRPAIEAAGVAALQRLFRLAQGDTGQAGVIAAFLLGCYNGSRFPFDLTEFRRLDSSLFEECLAVLRMDANPRQEIHCYFEDGGTKFEALARRRGLVDHRAGEL